MERKITVTFKEIIMFGTVLTSIVLSYASIKHDVSDLKVTTDTLSTKIDSLQAEQIRINGIVNFLYGEGVKDGWKMSKTYADGIQQQIDEHQSMANALK